MNNRNILILTGAGFGKDAGLPLENEIMARGVEICEKKKPDMIEELRKRWNSIDPNHTFDFYSFEESLTKVILEEQLSSRSDGEKREIRDIKLAVLEILAQALKEPLSGQMPKIYEAFLDLYKDRACFATLNYDYLIERFLISKKVHWDYGVDFPEVNFDLTVNNSYVKGEVAEFPNIFHYLKLHGSFNWNVCLRCGNARITELKYFGVSGEPFSMHDRFSQMCTRCQEQIGAAPVMEPLIVPPSAIKYYNTPIFLQLWFRFTQVVHQVEKLIIIGCSIRDDDTMLIQSLYNLSQRNPNLRKVVVVNPDESVKEKVRTYTQMKVTQYKSMDEFLRSHKLR